MMLPVIPLPCPAADVYIDADFYYLGPNIYSVHIPQFTGGSVGTDLLQGSKGTRITLTVTPAQGYSYKEGSLKVTITEKGTDVPLTYIYSSSFTFTMPDGNVNVSAEFTANLNTTGYFILKTSGVKSLFISDMKVQTNARAIGDISSIQTLSYINAAGQNTPIYFISPSGKTVVLDANYIQRVDEQRTLVSFYYYYEVSEIETELNGQKVTAYVLGSRDHFIGDSYALIDWAGGKVYDFKEYSSILFAQDGNLYTKRNRTIYKIDLNTLSSAVPLNNQSFYPFNEIYASIVLNNKIISSAGYSFDINIAFPPQAAKTAFISIEELNLPIVFGYQYQNWSDNNGNYPYNFQDYQGFLIQDLEGTPWYFNLYGYHWNGEDFGLGKSYRYIGDTYVGLSVNYNQEPYIICKPSIDDAGQMSVSERTNGTISFPTGRDCYIFFLDPVERGITIMSELSNYIVSNKNNGFIICFENGFIRVRKKARGLQVDSIALSLPTKRDLGYSTGKHFFNNNDNYLYWLDGTVIKRLYLGAGNTTETLYSNDRIVPTSSFTASGNNLIFNVLAEDNISVYTYSLPMYQPGAQPRILSTSDVKVRNIMELNF